MPICKNAAEHVHHIKLRSRDGGHEEWNLVGLCASCHHRGLHGAKITVRGRAGEELVWETGLQKDGWTTVGDDEVRRADTVAGKEYAG